MDPDGSIQIISFICCIILSSLFSACETAFFSLNKIRISNKADEGSVGAKRVMRLLHHKDRIISTILIGNNIVNLTASSLATTLAIEVFGNVYVGVATGIVTFIVIVFCEITPKTIATRHADSIAMFFSIPLQAVQFCMLPLVFCLNKITELFVRLMGGREAEVSYTENELMTMVNISHEQGELQDEEKSMLQNVFTFGDDVVRKIMTPRVNVVAVDVEWSYDEIMEMFREHQFSRMPVYKESPDHIVGVLNIKDLAFANMEDKVFDIRDFIREPMICYEFNQIRGVFDRMRKDRAGLAIACDEYGIMTGVVALEDFIEEIVGDITDEYDGEDEFLIRQLPDGSYIMDGAVSIELFNEMSGSNIGADSQFDSIGGFILGLIDDIPEEGMTIRDEVEGVSFTIQKVDHNRITQLSAIIDPPLNSRDDEPSTESRLRSFFSDSDKESRHEASGEGRNEEAEEREERRRPPASNFFTKKFDKKLS